MTSASSSKLGRPKSMASRRTSPSPPATAMGSTTRPSRTAQAAHRRQSCSPPAPSRPAQRHGRSWAPRPLMRAAGPDLAAPLSPSHSTTVDACSDSDGSTVPKSVRPLSRPALLRTPHRLQFLC
uniref:Uncharacterized protein n=1 Tax=Arundo donax TaxID=35708 RepID=A0A0A9ATL4_ARUDO